MELTFFNDILTETIDKVVSGITERPVRGLSRQEGRKDNSRLSTTDSRDSNRLIQSCFVSRDGSRDLGSISESNQSRAHYPSDRLSAGPTMPQLKTNCTVSEWLQHNAPILLSISANRLGLNLEQLETINLIGLPEERLVEMKKKAKQELKEYDNKFSSEFGKQPSREEKEPMRPLYIYYRALKQAMEAPAANPQEVLEKLVDELVAKKSQRNDLRAKLESYQEEFVRRNNRRIRFRNDIVEVESDYNLYKKLKDDITSLEEKCRQHLAAHPNLRAPN